MTDYGAFVTGALDTLRGVIAENNDRALVLKSAGNTAALVHEIREEKPVEEIPSEFSTKIAEFRAAKEAALAKVLEWETAIDKYIVDNGLVKVGDVNVEEVTEAWKSGNTIVREMTKVLKSLPGGEAALAEANLPEVVGIPGTRSGGNSGATGIKRPRLSAIKYRVAGTEAWQNVDKDGKSNLTILATILSTKDHAVAAKDIQGPLFDAAGTQDLSTLNGKPVEFVFTVGDVNYEVTATPSVPSAE